MIHISLRFILIVLLSLGLLSCTKDDINVDLQAISACDDGIQNGTETGIDCGGGCSRVCPRVNALEGELASWLDLEAGEEYQLTGPLLIRDGGVLNINEGVIINVTSGINAYIGVAQGGKIYVNGKKDNPVIMTSDASNPEAGDWGGLVLCGKAPTNRGVNSRSTLLDIFYGGDEPEDSSGIIKYLRLEYTGAKFENEARFNGITFYGVGSSTFVNFVQSYKSLGNGFEVNGGTLDLNFMMSSGSALNGVKITEGWMGEGNLWYLSDVSTNGIRLENDVLNESAAPLSSGVLSEITLIGPASNAAIFYANGGGIFTLNQLYTTEFQAGIQIQDANESTLIDQGSLQINSIEFDNTLPNFLPTNYNGSNPNFYQEGNSVGAGNAADFPSWAESWSK